MPTSSRFQLSAPETWVDSHGDSLFTYALHRVPNDAVAEELVQETFVAALSSREKYRGSASEKTWLVGILKHKIRDHYRTAYKKSATTRENIDNLTEDMFDEHDNWLSKPAKWRDIPHLAYEQNEFLSVLEQCLQKMSQRAAAVFRMREIVQAETEEICEDLGISQANYWVIMHRARLQTRKCLETNWLINGQAAT